MPVVKPVKKPGKKLAKNSAKKATKNNKITAKNYYAAVERRVTKDSGLPLQSVMQGWDFRLIDELFAAKESMTVGEFKKYFLALIKTGKIPGSE